MYSYRNTTKISNLEHKCFVFITLERPPPLMLVEHISVDVIRCRSAHRVLYTIIIIPGHTRCRRTSNRECIAL